MVAILFIAKTVTLIAQDVNTPWSLIAFENEKEVAVYNIEMIGNIEITVQNLTVALDDGAIFSHPIATTTFGFDARNQDDGSANEAFYKHKWNMQYSGGRLHFSEAVNGVAIYALNGALVVRFTGYYTEIPVNLRQGIYVVKAGGKSAKLLVDRNGYGDATAPSTENQTLSYGLQTRASGHTYAGNGIKTYWILSAGNSTLPLEMSNVERFHFKTYQSIVFTMKNGNTFELDGFQGMQFDSEPVWATASKWNLLLTQKFGGFALGADASLPTTERYKTNYATAFSEKEIICYDIRNKTERRYPISYLPAFEARISMFRGSNNFLTPAYSYKSLPEEENMINFLSIENGNLLWYENASNWPNNTNLGKTTFSLVEDGNLKAVFEGGEYIFKEKPDDPTPDIINANTKANVYEGYFLFGSNMGWLNSNWLDEDVADILVGNASKNIEGAGVTSLRPALYYYFIQDWGYDVRVNTFKHYENIGAKQNVVFIGDGPTDAHREKKQYTSVGTSQSFENLYEPIWDNGENGTPVNDNNYYALYVYEVAKRYKGQVKFWEIKNEPDLTYSDCGWTAPGSDCNWWDRDPMPSELINWYAPVQSYIRLLRVSYEVIKYVDPEAFICVGGIGYASFLDAILRNTDNPDGGKTTDAYPYKGGAWFDCLSFHCYPMYSLRAWDNSIGWFRYFRHSDAAVNALKSQLDEHKAVLSKYGYGSEYPAKEVIVTETNVPNKQLGENIGSPEAQRNYLVKAAVIGQKNRISGIYVYGPWDNAEQNGNGWEYDYMGLYKPLPYTPAGALRINESGIAWRTVSRMLRERRYDAVETAKLSLPAGIEGGAFHSTKTNDYVYVLWAITSTDLSESASANYTFPAAINAIGLNVISWDGNRTVINDRAITLTGSPVYIELRIF